MLPNDVVFFILVCAIQISYGHRNENFTDNDYLFESETCFCTAGERLLIFHDAINGVCRCKCIGTPNFDLKCQPCPDYLQLCSNECCFLDDAQCNADGFCRLPGELDFVTAAKVAILFALIVTCIAVLVALFRSFFLPRWCNARSRLAHSRSEPQRSSLNSVQRFVVERMRSRPPCYEHQPEKPPSYEDCINSEDPPGYSVAVISEFGDPPAYSAAFIDIPEVEGSESLALQELHESALVLDVRTLSNTIPSNLNPNTEEHGNINQGFAADETGDRNTANVPITT